MSKPIKVVHISSAHKDGDVRIFHKECVSLANSGFDVSMVIPNTVSRLQNGVKVVSVNSRTAFRIVRAIKTVNRVYRAALALDADIYHLHDPELLRIALKLKRKGKKVIYDAHEDLPRQVLAKSYIPQFFRNTLSRFLERYENKRVAKLDGVVAATPFIRDRFLKINPLTIDVNNFPIRDELFQIQPDFQKDGQYICYVGSISEIRGVYELVKALPAIHSRLILAGEFDNDDFRKKLESTEGWHLVDYVGYVDRCQVADIYRKSFAGIVTLHPTINYLDSLPVKMFEYMAAGVPVIASDFPFWKQIISASECGICVDPMDYRKIAEVVLSLKNDQALSRQMSVNGKKAVDEKYNWSIEENKLIAFYKKFT